MRRDDDRIFAERRGLVGGLTRLSILALVVLATALGLKCKNKGTPYFLDGVGVGNGPFDTVEPVFTNKLPCVDNLALNATFLRFDVADPTPGTGINTSAATARTATGASVPLSFTGSTGTVEIGGLTGQQTVTVSVPDNATPTPNVGTTIFMFTVDREAPSLTFTTEPSATASSNAASFPFNFAGTLTSGTGRVEVIRRAGAQCADSDALWPQGTAGGQVSANTVSLSMGAFNTTITAFNGVPAGGMPVVGPYGFRFTAEDQAMSNACPSTLNPNRITLCRTTNLTWGPGTGTGFDISSLEFCTIHGVGQSTVRARGSTTPAQPNAPFSGMVTGPGVVGSGQFSGMTDANGRGVVNQTINQFGTYTTLFRVISGGITRERTGTHTVDASQGCTF